MMNRLRRLGANHASEQSNLDDSASTTSITCRALIGDVVDQLALIPSASVRLIICDPPYNIQLADWDQHTHYADWCVRWLTECQRILLPNGSLALFGGMQYQSEQGGDLLDLIPILRQQLGMRLVNMIIWNYPNGMSAHRFFANRHEEIAWFTNGKNYVFNLDAVREPYDEKTKQAYYRDQRLRKETIDKGRNPTNVWQIPRLHAQSKERTGHPTQKPRALIRRLMLALSNQGDLVVDPFAGSGVTLRVAAELGRQAVGIDRASQLHQYVNHQWRDLPATPWHVNLDCEPASEQSVRRAA